MDLWQPYRARYIVHTQMDKKVVEECTAGQYDFKNGKTVARRHRVTN